LRWRIVLHLVLAVAGPLALLAARRFPGPTVALVSGLALLDVLTAPVCRPALPRSGLRDRDRGRPRGGDRAAVSVATGRAAAI
jgi:hypothetical protein